MCGCDNVNGIYCESHRQYKSAQDKFMDFKKSDLAFFIERLQIVLDVISVDYPEMEKALQDAQQHASNLWDAARLGDARRTRRALNYFHGFVWAVPDTHKWSYKHMVAQVGKAI